MEFNTLDIQGFDSAIRGMRNPLKSYDKADSASNLVLIQSQKNGKTGLRIDPPLILYNDNGLMSDEYKKLQTEVRL